MTLHSFLPQRLILRRRLAVFVRLLPLKLHLLHVVPDQILDEFVHLPHFSLHLVVDFALKLQFFVALHVLGVLLGKVVVAVRERSQR